MEITMHENIRLTKQDTWNGSHLANAGRNEAISTSPLEHLERWHSNKKCGTPVIRSRTEAKIRNRQIKRLA
jgi:hypothetical protein